MTAQCSPLRPVHGELKPQLTKAKHSYNPWVVQYYFFFLVIEDVTLLKKTEAAQRVVLNDSKMLFCLRVLLDRSRENANSADVCCSKPPGTMPVCMSSMVVIHAQAVRARLGPGWLTQLFQHI